MQTLDFKQNMLKNVPCVVSIGVFDGFHLGHLAIIEKNVSLARENNWQSVAITFSVNPKMAKGSMKNVKPLASVYKLNEMLTKSGLNWHCVIDFCDDMSKLSGEEFIAMLCTSYNVKAMVVGTSFRCGNSTSSAGVSQIAEYLSKYTSSTSLVVVPSVFVNGEEVSSSLIRRCLLTGNLEKVSSLLGRAYSLDMRDVPFKSSQNRLLYDVRTLEQLLPKEGLYMVKATANEVFANGKLQISENHLALELPVRMIPNEITFLGE